MFGKNFDNAPSLSTGGDVPLKVSSGDVEYSVELVRNKLVGGENPKCGRIASKQVLASARNAMYETLTL